MISIIVLTKNHPKLLATCLTSMKDHTDSSLYEIVVIDNGSDHKFCEENKTIVDSSGGSYFFDSREFNFSALCNEGAAQAAGDTLLFLNDDIEIASKDWLALMQNLLKQDHVGAVGALLYYPDGKAIQHAGICETPYGPSHIQVVPSKETIVAVTGACLLITKEVLQEAGGWDEDFPVAYNDVALCYRLQELGYTMALSTDVRIYHHESITRGTDSLDVNKLYRQRRELRRLYQKFPRMRQTTSDTYQSFGEPKYHIMPDTKPPLKTLHIRKPRFAIDELVMDMRIFLRGWILEPGEVYVMLIGKKHSLILPTRRTQRKDLEELFPNQRVKNAGWETTVALIDLEADCYQVYLATAQGKVHTKRSITVKE